MYDVIIIGAGVIGCSVARFLSRYRVKACVLERAEDVCCGTSKANSAIIHAGFDARHGTLMAEYNVRGNAMMTELAAQLDIPFIRNGSLVVCLEEQERDKLEELCENGRKNGVEGLEIVGGDRLRELEPNLSPKAAAALWAPTGGIVCPFEMTIALAENARANGVEFFFDTEVISVMPDGGGWTVRTGAGDFSAKCVVNAAGVYADIFHNMVSGRKLHITPRKGEYCLLDRSAGGIVRHTVFQLPGAYGKGVLVTPTVHGNILMGPTAADIEDREGVNTTAGGLEQLMGKAGESVNGLPLRQIITSFAGLRAHEDGGEFVLGEVPDAPGFFDCAGIESPGLSSAPAIGQMIAGALRDKLDLEDDPAFEGTRKGICDPRAMSREERAALIREKPEYGQIVCRCEGISEGEILEAIRRPLGAKSLDGVKRRVRAGMGRCQGGFCSPRVMELLARELGTEWSGVTKSGGASRLILGNVKDRLCQEGTNDTI